MFSAEYKRWPVKFRQWILELEFTEKLGTFQKGLKTEGVVESE